MSPLKIASCLLVYNVPHPTVTWNLLPTGLQWALEICQQETLLYHLGQLYVKYNWQTWYPLFRLQKNSPPTEIKKEDESCILDQLDLGEISTW